MLQRASLRYLAMANRYTAGSHHPRERTDLLTQEQLQSYEKFITVEPTYQENKLSPGNVLPKIGLFNSSTFVKFLAESFSSLESEAESDSYYPPRLSENSVFIYQSYQLGSNQRLLRSGDYLLAGFLVGIANYPLYCMAYFGATYLMVTNSMFYALQRNLVIRADLLPHIQAVNFQKVGAFGCIINKTVQVDDLEHVDYAELKEKENYFWGLNYKYVDHRMIFRSRQTKEVFLFDRTGLWSKEGLNHRLLN